MDAMVSARKKSRNRAGSLGKGGKQAISLRLDPVRYRRLELLAQAENRTPTNYVETVLKRAIDTAASATEQTRPRRFGSRD